jgi:eukaryotic-like serine/threonine-protein kinase
MTEALVNQTIAGRGNIFTGTGDVNVSYVLNPADADQRNDLLVLVRKVREFWVRGILENSVHDAALMEIGKETRPEAVETPWDAILSRPGRTSENISPGQSLSDLFAGVSYTLLILGDAGSGKTVTLLQLARELLTASENDSRLPVPVVFNLSSWSGKRLPIFDWVIEELRTKYYVPAKSGRAWLEANRLLLLLDGLDEVKAADRGACVHAINQFMPKQGVSGLAICSRQREYLELETRLRLGGAILLQPLSDAQLDNYLSQCGEALQPLRRMLARDEQLKDLARSPLMLSIMTLAYPKGAPMQSVEGESTESRREHIFAAYIEQMFNRRSNVLRGFTAPQVRHYLQELAQKLERRTITVFMLDEIQPDWLGRSRSASILYWYVTRAIGCLVLAAAVAIPAWLGLGREIALIIMGFGCVAAGVEGTASLWFNRKDIQIKCGSAVFIGIRALVSLFAYSTVALIWAFVGNWDYDPVFVALVMGILALAYCSGIYILRAAASIRDHDIFAADRIVWRWQGSWRGVPWGIVWTATVLAGLTMFCALWLSETIFSSGTSWDYLRYEISSKASMRGGAVIVVALIAGATIGMAIYGLTPASRQDKIRPNEGIRMSLSNGLKCGATLGVLISGLLVLVMAVLALSGSLILIVMGNHYYIALAVGIVVLVSFRYGLLDVIHHWILRLLLYWRNVLPFRVVKFLNYSCDLIFLQRVGGGYIFIHRLILDYFASSQTREGSPRTAEH